MEHLEGAWKLERISPRAYQHPADRAATAALQQVPYLDQVVRRLNIPPNRVRRLQRCALKRRATRRDVQALR